MARHPTFEQSELNLTATCQKHHKMTDAHGSSSGASGATCNRIVILAGQSNAVGRGRAADDHPALDMDARINWCNDKNFGEPQTSAGWVQMQPQLGRFGRHFGPEASLRLGGAADGCGASTFVIKFAMGSTSIGKEWAPDSELLEDFFAHVERAISQVPVPRQVCALFWLQGESDTSKKRSAMEYHGRCVEFVRSVRNRLCAPLMAFVASEIVWNPGKALVAKVNEALRSAVTELQPAALVSCDGYSAAGDKLAEEGKADDHLDSATLTLIGQRFSETYCALHESASASGTCSISPDHGGGAGS